jgi:hypothetical protein
MANRARRKLAFAPIISEGSEMISDLRQKPGVFAFPGGQSARAAAAM